MGNNINSSRINNRIKFTRNSKYKHIFWRLVDIIYNNTKPSRHNKKTNKTSNYGWLLLGIVLLLCAQDILKFEVIGKLIFPAILVFIGLSLLFKDKVGKKVKEKIKTLNEEGLEEYYATFSGQEINKAGEEFKGASLNAIFGGIDLKLKDAIIQKDILINATSVFGGIDIIVPANVNVKVQSTSIFGGTDNKITKQTENLPTIYVKAFCLFGGIDIKWKKHKK